MAHSLFTTFRSPCECLTSCLCTHARDEGPLLRRSDRAPRFVRRLREPAGDQDAQTGENRRAYPDNKQLPCTRTARARTHADRTLPCPTRPSMLRVGARPEPIGEDSPCPAGDRCPRHLRSKRMPARHRVSTAARARARDLTPRGPTDTCVTRWSELCYRELPVTTQVARTAAAEAEAIRAV